MNKPNEALEKIKAFGMTNQMLLEDLARVSKEYRIDLGHRTTAPTEFESAYYPQFAADIRAEAASMAKHYELFYCLEVSIRRLVSDSLETSCGRDDWWGTECVPNHIRQEVHSRI